MRGGTSPWRTLVTRCPSRGGRRFGRYRAGVQRICVTIPGDVLLPEHTTASTVLGANQSRAGGLKIVLIFLIHPR
jgi:hypothetical protein